MKAVHTQEPRVINVDKNAAYPKAIDELKEKEELSEQVELQVSQQPSWAGPPLYQATDKTRNGISLV